MIADAIKFVRIADSRLVQADAIKFVQNNVETSALYVHTDQIGTPQKITDNSGVVVWDAVARPFGDGMSITGSATNNKRFPGQYFDAETAFHYNHWRDYDPVIGRYVEADPIGIAGGLNPYSYAGSNPASLTDPNGQNPVLLALFALGVGVDVYMQYQQTHDFRCVNFWEAGLSGVLTAFPWGRFLEPGFLVAGSVLPRLITNGAVEAAVDSSASSSLQGFRLSQQLAAEEATGLELQPVSRAIQVMLWTKSLRGTRG